MPTPGTSAVHDRPPDFVDHKASSPKGEKKLEFGQIWSPAAEQVSRPARPTLDGSHRPSIIQFSTDAAEQTRRNSAVQEPRRKDSRSRKMSSPPPPPTYQRGISFDTFDNKDASVESFTLQYRHTDYKRTARSRTFLCGTDTSEYSEYALEWMIDSLIDDGDEIICLRVVDKDSKYATETAVERGRYKEEASKLLENVVKKNTLEQKAISVILEFAVGKVESTIQRMIQLYEPASLVVGTRGRSLGGMQGLMPGSVSKYCLQHSPVPVIVVRPTYKRNEKKLLRQQETSRSIYTTMLDQATKTGTLSLNDRGARIDSLPGATLQEAAAVAKAIGPSKGILRNKHAPMSPSPTSPEESVAPTFALPIGFLSTEAAPRADLAMKSPIIAALAEWDDSPTDTKPPSIRGRSPAPKSSAQRASSTGGDEDAVASGDEDDIDGAPTIIDHRRPSTRETTPWLNQILRQPDRPPSRHRSASRTSRSRSRTR